MRFAAYTATVQQEWKMPRRRPEFEPGEADAEAAKLKKFSDAGGSQIQWLSDAGRFPLFEWEQYIFNLAFSPPFWYSLRSQKEGLCFRLT